MTALFSQTSSPARTRVGEPTWLIQLRRGALVTAATLIGLAGGFFFTYQISVTRALAVVDDATYVNAFQAINETIRNTWFGIVFFGAIPALCAALALHWQAPRRRTWLAIALGCYAATFAITAVGNVPLNDALGVISERDPATLAAARDDFEGPWNLLNLARTLTAIASVVAMGIALTVPGRSQD